MTTPNDGQQGPYGPNPYQQGTREPGEDVPRQQSPAWEYGQQGTGPYGQQGPYAPYPQGGDPRYPGGTGPPSYLHGARAGFGEAVGQGLGHLLTFRGRASRSAFWWFALFTLIVQVVIDLIVSRGTHGTRSADGLGVISTLLTLAVSVRRLHDSDHSGWWWLIGLVPIVGWIVLLYFYLKPGTRGPNRFDARV